MAATVGMVPDPLGAHAAVNDFTHFQRWTKCEVPEYDIMVDDPSNMKTSPFYWDDSICEKILIW